MVHQAYSPDGLLGLRSFGLFLGFSSFGPFLGLSSFGPLVGLGSWIVGHIVGRIKGTFTLCDRNYHLDFHLLP